jgi:hypothetical protein
LRYLRGRASLAGGASLGTRPKFIQDEAASRLGLIQASGPSQPMSRPISQLEAAIVERALLVAPCGEVSPLLIESVQSLHVTATCDCGCATVWFGPEGAGSTGRIVADARATAGGAAIDVIVWSNAGAIVGLELVGVDAVPLPAVDSVRQHGP